MHDNTSQLARQVLIEKEVEQLQRSVQGLSEKLSKYMKSFKDEKEIKPSKWKLIQKNIDKSVNQINDYNHFKYPWFLW